MKKCKGCNQEIDKYTIACQYCGKLAEEREKSENNNDPETEATEKKPGEEQEGQLEQIFGWRTYMGFLNCEIS